MNRIIEKLMKISVLFPARNEELLIKKSVEDVYSLLKKKKFSFEILIIENGTNDHTIEFVKRLQLGKPEVKLLHSKPGYGYALREGLKKANGEFVVLFNVDFYDLSLLELIEIDLLGADLIIGSKTTYWANDERPITRRIVTKLFNIYLALIHGFKGSDTHGIKILRKDVIKQLLKTCKTYSGIFDSELVLRAQNFGYKIIDIPVSITEKRKSTFKGRLFQTPKDILELYRSLK